MLGSIRAWYSNEATLTGHVSTDSAAPPRSTPFLPSSFIDRPKLLRIAEAESHHYRKARPFPHVVIDNVFPEDLLDAVIADLPSGDQGWTRYNSANERKSVFSDVNAFGPAAETMAYALNSLFFINFLEQLTGVDGIVADPYLHAAGYMRVEPGGFLDLHYDFTMHKHLPLERRINVLVYLNRDWRPEWGGQLELHSNDELTDPNHQEIAIEPIFNRVVIFNTPNALHGHRRPVACPPVDRVSSSRASISSCRQSSGIGPASRTSNFRPTGASPRRQLDSQTVCCRR